MTYAPIDNQNRRHGDRMLSELLIEVQRALDINDPLGRAELLATVVQPYAAWATRWSIAEARERGLSWPAIAGALGQQHSTILRQYQAGGPVVTARPYGARHDRQDELRRAAADLVHEMFPTRALQESDTGAVLYVPVQTLADRMISQDAQPLLAAVAEVLIRADSLRPGYPSAAGFDQERAAWAAIDKLDAVYRRDRILIEIAGAASATADSSEA
jgi:hypothetical protein